MYEEDLELNIQQGLICQPNQTFLPVDRVVVGWLVD